MYTATIDKSKDVDIQLRKISADFGMSLGLLKEQYRRQFSPHSITESNIVYVHPEVFFEIFEKPDKKKIEENKKKKQKHDWNAQQKRIPGYAR